MHVCWPNWYVCMYYQNTRAGLQYDHVCMFDGFVNLICIYVCLNVCMHGVYVCISELYVCMCELYVCMYVYAMYDL